MLVPPQVRISTEDRHPELNTSQCQAVDEIFLSREKIVGLDGVAGAGKTTTLSVIREGAEAEGWTPSWALRICSTAAWPTSAFRADGMTRRFIRTTQRRCGRISAATCPIPPRFTNLKAAFEDSLSPLGSLPSFQQWRSSFQSRRLSPAATAEALVDLAIKYSSQSSAGPIGYLTRLRVVSRGHAVPLPH